MRAAVALAGDGACIAESRRFAVDFLGTAQTERGVAVSSRALQSTALVVSELVTNACKYAPGPVHLELRITGGLLAITVRDGDPVLPRARAADSGRVGQHGLEIVTAVAVAVEMRREREGKRITAHVALTDAEEIREEVPDRAGGVRSRSEAPREGRP